MYVLAHYFRLAQLHHIGQKEEVNVEDITNHVNFTCKMYCKSKSFPQNHHLFFGELIQTSWIMFVSQMFGTYPKKHGTDFQA